MAKPTSQPAWTVGNPNFGTVTIEPTAQKKEDGWLIDERPPREFMNWLFFNIDEWITYFDGEIDVLAGLGQAFDAVIAPAGTHATINDLMADVDIASKKRVLVATAQTLTSTQVIDQDDMEFIFKPQAVHSQGAALTLGIQVDAERCTLRGGRFTDFSTGGDKAIQLTANAKNCLIVDNRFNNNSTEIDDLGSGNLLANNIVEVP